ncbi:hypothetical protein [Streptomyces sp. NBC_00207]|uniref:hypothetical protein n=1 Tax=unclassified Streptomyces TaxID=2593676 RepID=UPI002884DF87|nr:hypothetical protein [Streptomyces sp. DSM 41633]
MPDIERKRWSTTIYFSVEETSDLADGASAVALTATMLPEATSKIVAMYAGLISLGLKVAVRRKKALGLQVSVLPFGAFGPQTFKGFGLPAGPLSAFFHDGKP